MEETVILQELLLGLGTEPFMDFSKFTHRTIYILRVDSISKNLASKFTKGLIQYNQKFTMNNCFHKKQDSLKWLKYSNKKSFPKKPNDLYD